MLLTFLLAAVLWNCNCWWNAANIYTFAVQPGYLDFDNLPDTNFSCDGKVIGGYYADVETGCQMFHVCTIGQKAEITDIKFLCLNGTVFDQETRVCERLDEVDCSKSESFFDLNLELYGNNGAGYGIAPEEPPEQEPAAVQCNADEEDCSGTSDYFDEEVTTAAPAPSSTVASTTSTTTSTQSTTTTTTTRKLLPPPPPPVVTTTSTAKPPPPPPPAISYPTNSPETIAALIALHNAFQESLKEREPGNKPQVQRYPPQQPPKPFTVANFQPPRHFPSKPQQQQPPPPQQPQPPPLYQQQRPVILSSERFGNQNFRHGFRLQNDDQVTSPPPQQQQQQQQQQQPSPSPPSPSYPQYSSGDQYSSYDEDVVDDETAADDETRRNFAREAPEASVSVRVQISSSSSKNSAIANQQQQQQQQRPLKSPAESPPPQQTVASSTAATTTTPVATTAATLSSTPPPPQPPADFESGDLYEDEYEELEDDEEFFKDVPKLRGRNRRRAIVVART